ncbi:MAG: MFS transporter [Myxococcota bacterium]
MWAYEQTGSAGQLGAVAAAGVLPGLVLSPLAGSLVDRAGLRAAMATGYAGVAAGALLVAALATAGRLLPEAALGRASGLVQLGDSTAQLVAPAVGGALLAAVGVRGVALVELAGAIVALAGVAVALRGRRVAAAVAQPVPAWRYVAQRPALLGLLALAGLQLGAVGFLEVLSAPIVLAVGSTAVLGLVRSVAGAGMLGGSVVMSVWGGPRDRLRGLVAFQALFGALLLAMSRAHGPAAMAAAACAGLACLPVVNGCAQVLWQTRVPAPLHGRVFALRRAAGLARPLGQLAAGALVDRGLEASLVLGSAGAAVVAATLLTARWRPLGAP